VWCCQASGSNVCAVECHPLVCIGLYGIGMYPQKVVVLHPLDLGGECMCLVR
jgi:hypothetical protein